MKKKILLIGAVFANLFAFAQEEAPVNKGLKINGYIDTYYKSNFGFNGGNVVNDGLSPLSESFELGNVNLKLSQDFGKVGFVAQVGFGKRAELANFDSSPATAVIIQQAYAYYKATDKLTLTAGNFSTYVGYEVIDAPANFHYSVSNLFQNGPFYHQGVKADYNLGEGLGLMVGFFNQMDRKSNAQSGLHGYNYGGQLKYNKENMNVYVNYLGGRDNSLTVSSDSNPIRNQFDLVADYRMGKAYVAFNPTYVSFSPTTGGDKSWYGGALYTQYAFTDKAAVGVRGGYINNKDLIALATGVADEQMWDITLTAPLTLAEGLKIVPEFRFDQTKNKVYDDADGKKVNHQFTVGLAAMYSF